MKACDVLLSYSVMELVGERYRPALGTAIQIGFSCGFMLQPAIAYGLRDEFWYQVAANTPSFLILPLIVYVHNLGVLSLCGSLTSEHEKPSLEVAPTTLLLTYSFQFRSAFQPTMLS